MTTYTLHYFPLRIGAEAIRYIFAYNKQPFEDKCVQWDDWPAVKATTPTGALPILDIVDSSDGRMRRMTQSIAIARYLGVEFGMTGESNEENARLDEAVDFVNADIFTEVIAKWFPPSSADEERVRLEVGGVMRDETHPPKFDALVKLLGLDSDKCTFLLGERVTWADFCIAAYIEFLKDTVYGGNLAEYNAPLSLYLDRVQALPGVDNYIACRPPYEH